MTFDPVQMFDAIDNVTFAAAEREDAPYRSPVPRTGWSITDMLPPRLQRAGFELTEDEDFVILWHEHEWIARFLGIATNMPNIIREAESHLETHPVVVDLVAEEV